jgi:DNA-binding MarR family transcriptional regulator
MAENWIGERSPIAPHPPAKCLWNRAIVGVVTSTSSQTHSDQLLADDVLATIGRLRRHFRSIVGRPWPSQALAALNGAHLELLRLVGTEPGVSVAEAAVRLGLAPNTVSTLVGALTEQGLLLRTPSPHDRRVARLNLTAAAQAHLAGWRERRSAVLVTALRQLSAAERDAVATAMPALRRLAELLPCQAAAAELAGAGGDHR